MKALLVQELRGLARHWPLWTLPVLVAGIGWAMLPVNADAYLTYVYNDPQGVDQQLENYRFDVWAVYTSGLGWAQLLALLVGASLVLRDPRLTGTEPGSPVATGPLIVAKAGAAALFAGLLALVDLAVVLPNAHAHLARHWVLAELARDGVAVHQLGLADGTVWTVMLCAAVGVPLFAIIGVGLAARAGRWWLVGVTAGLLSVASLLFMVKDKLPWYGDTADRTIAVLLLVLAAPALPWLLYWYATLSPWAPLALGLTAAFAPLVLLRGDRAVRRRLARAASVAADQPDASGAHEGSD